MSESRSRASCSCDRGRSSDVRGGYEWEKAFVVAAGDFRGPGGLAGDPHEAGGGAAAARAAKTHPEAPPPPDGEDRSSALAASSAAGHDADARAALSRVGTTASECSAAAGSAPGEPCSSRQVLSALQGFIVDVGGAEHNSWTPDAGDADSDAGSDAEDLPSAQSPAAQAVRDAARALGCGSESCVIAHPRFRSFAQTADAGLRDTGGARRLDIELAGRFKPAGPRATTDLLNNFNIDGVLQGWAGEFPRFYNFGFNMMDFDAVGSSLATTDVAGVLEGLEVQNLGPLKGGVKRPCDTFACVLNTDVSTGRGKHWVAVFGDCRGECWTVEYFNSAGNPPPPPITRWMETTAARLAEFRATRPQKYGAGPVVPAPLTDVRHQDSQTECGLYSLYFIRRRLEGAPAAEFRENRIPDDAMIGFRKHVFRAA